LTIDRVQVTTCAFAGYKVDEKEGAVPVMKSWGRMEVEEREE
jgi:hypothetical protein